MLYENVKAECQKKGISIRVLEQKSGLGNGVIRGWKVSNPRIDSLKAVADILGVKVEDLMRD